MGRGRGGTTPARTDALDRLADGAAVVGIVCVLLSQVTVVHFGAYRLAVVSMSPRSAVALVGLAVVLCTVTMASASMAPSWAAHVAGLSVLSFGYVYLVVTVWITGLGLPAVHKLFSPFDILPLVSPTSPVTAVLVPQLVMAIGGAALWQACREGARPGLR